MLRLKTYLLNQQIKNVIGNEFGIPGMFYYKTAENGELRLLKSTFPHCFFLGDRFA